MSEEDPKFEEFLDVINQLEPAARRDVLDIATFQVWKQTREPAPWRRVMRGAILYFVFVIQKRITHKGKP